MNRIYVLVVAMALVACRREEPKTVRDVPLGGQRPPTQTRVATAPAPAAVPSSDLLTDPDGFVHERAWSLQDSLRGQFIRVLHQHPSDVTTDSLPLPGGVRVGMTTMAALQRVLGDADGRIRQADTLILEYASPFIGPDESVFFCIVSDTLRKVVAGLFPG